MLQLVLPQEGYWQSFQEGLRDIKNNPSPYDVSAYFKALEYTDFAEYKQYCDNDRLGIGLKEGYVPSTVLWLIQDEKFVGFFVLRHNLTENLKKQGGHIAYLIIPSKRRQGLAALGLKMCCQYAYYHFDIKQALITCKEENIASYKTMTKVMREYGGYEDEPIKFVNFIERRVWINTAKVNIL